MEGKKNNMANEIALKPSYWASVSGGKDSLYMLYLILNNLDKYPLDGVVHFELEIDYPFIKNVIDYMQSECEKHGIKFVRIKPRKTWEELYAKYGFPTRVARWCNNVYKLDAKKQLVEFMKSLGYNTYFYIGYCKDEVARYTKRNIIQEIYPLVNECVLEQDILQWAKTQPIFNDFYKFNRRCGCMYCPMTSYQNLAYLYEYYPENFSYMIDKMRETEKNMSANKGYKWTIKGNPKYDVDYVENIVKTKWIKKLHEKRDENKNI